jgi:hypothetical protein
VPAVYTLTGGRLLQGRMLMTVAQQLGITFDQAQQMAEAAATAGFVEFVHGSSVTLTEEGRLRGTTLKPPGTSRPRAKRSR